MGPKGTIAVHSFFLRAQNKIIVIIKNSFRNLWNQEILINISHFYEQLCDSYLHTSRIWCALQCTKINSALQCTCFYLFLVILCVINSCFNGPYGPRNRIKTQRNARPLLKILCLKRRMCLKNGFILDLSQYLSSAQLFPD